MRTCTSSDYIEAVKNEAHGQPRADDLPLMLMLLGKTELDLVTDATEIRKAVQLARIEGTLQQVQHGQMVVGAVLVNVLQQVAKPSLWQRLVGAWRALRGNTPAM